MKMSDVSYLKKKVSTQSKSLPTYHKMIWHKPVLWRGGHSDIALLTLLDF